ncbi:LacI family transcriptional regulator [Bordetella genomosp. 8]|uniref:LacI family transcriptional regulator n=1 Tax=Bordetella genomosp. 8 TaxID=1416806 RepID=A0A1W6YM42_9BORD|nr:tripartite tricarboxylate transporter substrate binding protein [Bordetella genomosp. 8]ARP82180.1 LacI family transcriptional regulator [Bordetella genomosp. 8]
MKLSLNLRLAAFAAGALIAASAASVHAADAYPSKPVTIIVPFGAGGVADAIPRIVGQKLNEMWGVPVIIENRPGASGNLGMGQVARAAADGYTLGLAPAGNLTVNPLLYTNLNFDTAHAFAPITLLATSPNILVVNPALPTKDFKSFIEYAKSKPGKLNFASPGAGSGAHLAGELLNQSAGINTMHIPYNGMAPAVTDVVAGNVDMMFAGVSSVLPFIRSGKLRALAVAGPHRLPQLPDVPTVAESGYPGFDVTSWYGLVAPAKTPPAVLAKLAQDVATVLKDPAVRQKFEDQGVEPSSITSQAFAAMIQDESRKWADIVKTAGIKPIQ